MRNREVEQQLRDEIDKLKVKIEWLTWGLEHIANGQHLCGAESLARQILNGHVWDSAWDPPLGRSLRRSFDEKFKTP
jgi:hypothetical protein